MSGFSLMVLGGSLGAVLFAVLAALVWQEGRRRRFDTASEYIVSDAVIHIAERLDEPSFERLGVDGVEAILEREVLRLQRLRTGAVAGATDDAVDWVAGRLAQDGVGSYAREDISAVLALEADYLLSIGALGSPVDDGGVK